MEQCKRPNSWALEHAGSQKEFDAINMAMDACGVPDAEGYENGCATASAHWGVALAKPESHNRPCTSPRRGLCRPGKVMPWSFRTCVCECCVGNPALLCDCEWCQKWGCYECKRGNRRQPQTRPAASA